MKLQFKAKSFDKYKWITGRNLSFKELPDGTEVARINGIRVKCETVCQSTGFEVKGVEAYLNDEIRHADMFTATGVIEFDPNGRVVINYTTGRQALLSERLDYIEIIGNIFD